MKTWWTGMEIFQLPPAKKYNAEHWASSTNKPRGMNTRWADNQYNHVLIIYLPHKSCLTEWKNTTQQQHYNTSLHSYEPRLGFWAARLNSRFTRAAFLNVSHGKSRMPFHWRNNAMSLKTQHSGAMLLQCKTAALVRSRDSLQHTVCWVIPEPSLPLCAQPWPYCVPVLNQGMRSGSAEGPV